MFPLHQDAVAQLLEIQDEIDILRTIEIPFGAGTSFPTAPNDGLLFYRSDLGWLCFYDATNTQWLTTQEWEVPITFSNDLTTTYSATTSAVRRGLIRSSHKAFFTRAQVVTTLAAGTSDGSNFWTVQLITTTTPTTVWSFTTASDSAGATTVHATNSMTNQPTIADTIVRMDLTKTGGPPNITPVAAVMFYRLVVT